MMPYRLVKVIFGTSNMVMNVETGAFIPEDENNLEWQAYQAWLAEGNLPDPPLE